MEQTLELKLSLRKLRRQRRELLVKLTTAFEKVNGALNGDEEIQKEEEVDDALCEGPG